jgi:hypothetical protein
LICALLFWAIAAFEYWHIGRQGYVSLHRWPDLILYGARGKWGWVYLWGFLGALFTFVGFWNLSSGFFTAKATMSRPGIG